MWRTMAGLCAVRTSTIVCLGTVAALAVGGCSSSSPSGSMTGDMTGSLAVTISAPGGVTPSVTIGGPAGYHRSLSATQTVTGLAPGTYTITAPRVSTTGSIVGDVDTAVVNGSPAAVIAGGTATASAAYSQVPSSGGLWVAQYVNPSSAVQFTAGQLGSSTSAAPAASIATGTRDMGAAFDGNGNLWIAQPDNNTVVEFTASQLASGGSPAPAVTLSATSGSLNAPAALAFDAGGNLWVANSGTFTVVEFLTAQLGSTSSPTAAVTLHKGGPGPMALAFDSAGDLWVAAAGDNAIAGYTPAALAAADPIYPVYFVSATGSSLARPLGMAFDPSGNLWVANGQVGINTVVEFTGAQLIGGGSPTPVVTLGSDGVSLIIPTGLAFDDSGNLWVASLNTPAVDEYAASQLGASGSPTPHTAISGVAAPWGLAFNPHSAALPLH